MKINFDLDTPVIKKWKKILEKKKRKEQAKIDRAIIMDLIPDIHFDTPPPTKEELEKLAKATAEMIADPTNTTIAIMPGKDGNPINITR